MMLESGQVLLARYTLLRKLGEGRTGVAWLARDRETARDRVLELLRPQLAAEPAERERFLRAARLQQQLLHPNIVRCLSVHEREPVHAVFEFMAGGDLSRWRGREWRQSLPLLAQVADGAAELHARGLVHRDLKSTNVLVGDDGNARIADLGLAAPVGDAAAQAGGSPFSSSPQQLDGLPPAIADDVYAFGALAYELLTGYPPFYPDPAPERIRAEPPAPMAARSAVPGELERLVQQCLAKRPEDRPQGLVEIAARLHAIAAESGGEPPTSVRSGHVVLRAPPAGPAAIEPIWQRPDAPGPSPGELRSQGFRRGVVAGAFVFLLVAATVVFFALPRWVERRDAARAPGVTAPAAPASEAKPAVAAERDLEQLAEAKREFEEARSPVAASLASLDARGAQAWGGERYARGKQGLADADSAFAARDYDTALARLRSAEQEIAAVATLAATLLRDALVAGAAAIDAGQSGEAKRQFELAAKLDPSNEAAKRGLRRVGTLEEVRGLLATAAEAERSGQPAEAQAAYRKALQLDPETGVAREALARLQAQASGAAFATAISQGLAALGRGDYVAARAAFERAGTIRPGAPEVLDGLARVERALGDRTIGSHLAAAQQAEQAERWSSAVTEYRKALEVDRNLLAAQQGVERAEPRAMLDAELAAYLERPERLFSSEVRGAARAALARARGVPSPGPVLTRQVDALGDLLAAAETPVRVAIASDNLTEITIYPVGRLGLFERRDMELLPGRYTVVGTRAGFRDVRRELTVLPGRETPVLVIRCEEQI
jgi:Tfp pilus assembly protein PilF